PAQCERIQAYAAVSAAPAPSSASRSQTTAPGAAPSARWTGIDTRNVITGKASPSNALGQSAARHVEKGSMSTQPSAMTTQGVPGRRGTNPSTTNRCVQSPEAGAPPLVSPVVSGLRTPRSAFMKTSPTPPSASPEKKKNRPRDGADQVAKSHCAVGSKGR